MTYMCNSHINIVEMVLMGRLKELTLDFLFQEKNGHFTANSPLS